MRLYLLTAGATVEVGTPRVLTDLDLPVLALLCGSVVGLVTVVSAVLRRTVVRSGAAVDATGRGLSDPLS